MILFFHTLLNEIVFVQIVFDICCWFIIVDNGNVMSNHCVLAQVVDVENYKHAIYSCCPVCSGRVFYSCDR